jgi:hypothetical protein
MDGSTQVSIDDLISAYLELREIRSEHRKNYEATDNVYKAQMEIIEEELHKRLLADGIRSFGGTKGTVYLELKTRAKAEDWALIHEFMAKNGRFDLLQRRLSDSVVKQFVEETGMTPPGITVFQEYQPIVRAK